MYDSRISQHIMITIW